MHATQFFRLSTLLLSGLLLPATLTAQNTHSEASDPGKYDLFGGYSLLSNSFNGHNSATSHTPLNGWNAALSAPVSRVSRGFGIKADVSGYYGTSLFSPQHPIFVLGGAQYSKHFGKETGYVEGLVGIGHLNKNWWGGEGQGSTNSFTAAVGAGLDTPIARNLSFRVQGDLLHANFTIPNDEIHALPNYFARISTGLVWRF